MKKTYLNPEMEIVNIETQQMLAASVGFGEETTSDKAEGRSYDFDDEE